VPHPATTEQATPGTRRPESTAAERTPRLAGERPASQEVQSALEAIPADSVTARTAGALRVAGPRRTIAEERAAFEQAVAEENTRQSEG
jgi:hypothetical protein